MIIREINVEDAAKFAALIQQVEAESDFMLMEEGERKTSPELESRRLEQMKKDNHSTIFVAEDNDTLVGYLIVIGSNVKRKKHSAYLVVGILKNYRGLGISTQLFEKLQGWAITHTISRLELTVVTKNETAVSLYKKMGFEIEGTKRNSLIIDNIAYDEYYMCKLL